MGDWFSRKSWTSTGWFLKLNQVIFNWRTDLPVPEVDDTLRNTTNDWGEPAISYIWTGWGREITGWSSRLQKNLPIILEEFIEYTPHFLKEIKPEDVNI